MNLSRCVRNAWRIRLALNGSAALESNATARQNTTRKGNALEKRIFEYFQAEIAADRFWAKKANCKVFSKKGYRSRDRNTEIVFDRPTLN